MGWPIGGPSGFVYTPTAETLPGLNNKQKGLKWAHVIACDRDWLHQIEKHRSVTEIAPAEITVFIGEQSPIRFGMVFVSAHRAIRYTVNHWICRWTILFLKLVCCRGPLCLFWLYVRILLVKNSEFCTGVRKTKTKDVRSKTRKTKPLMNCPSNSAKYEKWPLKQRRNT